MEKAMLFVREQSESGKNEKNPSFIFEGSVGTDLRYNLKYVNKTEIEQLAKLIGAEVVYLRAGKNDEDNKDTDLYWYHNLFWNLH